MVSPEKPLTKSTLAALLLTSISVISVYSSALFLGGCQSGEGGGEGQQKTKAREIGEHPTAVRKYMRDLQEHIKGKWSPSEEEKNLHGMVRFKVKEDGGLGEVTVLEPSGNELFDKHMLAAVSKAAPLPKPPSEARPPVDVDFAFDMKVLEASSYSDDPDELKRVVETTTEKLIKRPDDLDLLKKRAAANLALNNYDEALGDLSKAIDKEPSKSNYFERAKAYSLAQKPGEYLLDARKAEALEPTDLECKLVLVDALERNGLLDEALQKITESIELAPEDPSVWSSRAYYFELKGDYAKAREDLEKALSIDKEHAAAYAYRGDAFAAAKDYGKALKDYNRAIKLNSDDENNYLRRARIYNQIGKYDKAIIDATEAIEMAPNLGEAYYYRAYANEQLGLSAQAKLDAGRAAKYGFSAQTK
jgi:TonB family protein